MASACQPAQSTIPPARSAPTIYDVAQLAGVSPSTVSRALHQPGRISARTAERVQSAADRLGYQLNPSARALGTGRTGTLAIVLSDITNPVYFELVRGAEAVAGEHDFTLVLADSQESADREFELAKRLQTAADGLLLVSSRLTDDQIRELAAIKPVVLTNRKLERPVNASQPAATPDGPALPLAIDEVTVDVKPGLRAAVLRLAELGHRRLGYLAGPSSSYMNRCRWETLFDLACEQGLGIVEIDGGQPTMAGGAEASRRVTAAPITAVIAYNDLMALGLLRACKESGVNVPGELSIVGFDDIFGAELTSPSLSTIRSPLREIGADAMRQLLSALGRGQDEPGVPLTTTFIERESIGPALRQDA